MQSDFNYGPPSQYGVLWGFTEIFVWLFKMCSYTQIYSNWCRNCYCHNVSAVAICDLLQVFFISVTFREIWTKKKNYIRSPDVDCSHWLRALNRIIPLSRIHFLHTVARKPHGNIKFPSKETFGIHGQSNQCYSRLKFIKYLLKLF